ncbi:hypothetical protein QR680_016177 [Steinernema hermaphroditum]|uniref:Uncharacterized protein n=1 Tax=Steinernema hermaphroditum TaxID=289476 RepID=A0AA39HAB0_9BILA|nr:hypothetical protein QR680_016177 [Steinernema hermaphroditum]
MLSVEQTRRAFRSGTQKQKRQAVLDVLEEAVKLGAKCVRESTFYDLMRSLSVFSSEGPYNRLEGEVVRRSASFFLTLLPRFAEDCIDSQVYFDLLEDYVSLMDAFLWERVAKNKAERKNRDLTKEIEKIKREDDVPYMLLQQKIYEDAVEGLKAKQKEMSQAHEDNQKQVKVLTLENDRLKETVAKMTRDSEKNHEDCNGFEDSILNIVEENKQLKKNKADSAECITNMVKVIVDLKETLKEREAEIEEMKSKKIEKCSFEEEDQLDELLNKIQELIKVNEGPKEKMKDNNEQNVQKQLFEAKLKLKSDELMRCQMEYEKWANEASVKIYNLEEQMKSSQEVRQKERNPSFL